MALHQVTVLQDLPLFTGNPKPGDAPFKPELDARTFLRSVENYFLQHQITNNERKLQILFSLIDKKRGDAIRLITCYAGKNVPFEAVKAEFLSMYHSFAVTEFRHAAQTLLDTKLTMGNMFCGMTSLELATRAVAEAYLSHKPLTRSHFGERTKIYPLDGTTGTVPPTPPPLPSTSAASTTPIEIYLQDVIQNVLMHVFIATQTPNSIYEKLAAMGPSHTSTKLMAETVKTVEKHKLMNASRKTETHNDVIWRAHQGQGTPQNEYSATDKRDETEFKCYNCGKKGHISKKCKSCSFCKKYGHKAKTCRERIAKAKGKYCSNCNLKDSHNTAECRKGKTKYNTVRVVQNDDYSDEWNLSNEDTTSTEY